MNDAINSFLKSRRFWVGVAAIAVPILNAKFGWGINEESFVAGAIVVVGWILGESVRSSQGAKPNVPPNA